ncbi:MAG TPA: acylphosphatase [Dokdonella sp.]|uniref:acylphosphatase n=1 Tax=Dokdonella sp. TaxID=2291710 RepID=UPI0025BB3470|nr:acylphosphatase [Dokdonella sp.]MBX3691961.1 acylphosphatase [Dokdonella sp.]MCW5568724.1 acylphosphatase [Dokdonella sp.]HNR91988.1 acylphosphatase [Dokdonella sp.]
MAEVRFLVSGRVQGVGFRAATRSEALRLDISGHARNLRDGDVEVIACGEDSAVEALAIWLHRGPPGARVDSVTREPWDGEPMKGFLTR